MKHCNITFVFTAIIQLRARVRVCERARTRADYVMSGFIVLTPF